MESHLKIAVKNSANCPMTRHASTVDSVEIAMSTECSIRTRFNPSPLSNNLYLTPWIGKQEFGVNHILVSHGKAMLVGYVVLVQWLFCSWVEDFAVKVLYRSLPEGHLLDWIFLVQWYYTLDWTNSVFLAEIESMSLCENHCISKINEDLVNFSLGKLRTWSSLIFE